MIWDAEVSEFESKADEVGEAGKYKHEGGVTWVRCAYKLGAWTLPSTKTDRKMYGWAIGEKSEDCLRG